MVNGRLLGTVPNFERMFMKFLMPVISAITLSILMAPTAVLADKGGNPGKGKGKGNAQQEQKYESTPSNDSVRIDFHFGDQDRRLVRDYYGGQAKGGKCPPGLAKKGNGCMPPGQAKKWAMGRPLPRDIVYYDLPRDLVVRLPPPPSGHRYVQVAGDVLLIAVGSSMVIDAIQDILR